MLFSEIRPFIRYARYLHLDSTTSYDAHIPYDARLFYVIDGCGQISALNNTYTLNKGELIIINSGIEYHLIMPKNSVTYLAINFDFTHNHSELAIPIPPRTKNLFKEEQIIERIAFDDLPEFNHVIYLKNAFDIERNLIAIEEEYSHRVIYSNIKISNLFSEILVDVSRKIQFESSPGSSNNTRNINPRIIIDYIYENYNKPLNNSDIGSLFGYHPNYVSSLVKMYTGLPLRQYMNHIRIVKATNYLDMGTMSVSEISKQCGFENLNYFSRYFKKFTGITPTEYMRQ